MNSKRLVFGIILFFAICNSVNATTVTVLDANFNNGSLSGWDVNSGTWIATNLDLNGAILDTGSISHDVNMPSSTIYNISYTARTDNPNLYGEFFFFTDQNGLADVNGYAVLLYNNIVHFERRIAGAPVFLLSTSGISLNNTHEVDISYINGTFNISIDNVSMGTVTDTTFRDGSKVFFVTENTTGTYAFDDVLITRETGIVDINFLRPKNEKTLAPIDGNWSVQLLNGLTSDYQNGNDSSKSFLVVQSDTNWYNFVVDDGNSVIDNYFPRTYSVISRTTDSNTLTIQPYLIGVNDGILVNLRVIDIPSNINVPNVRTTLKTGIEGFDVTVEDEVTDSTGISQLVMISQKIYDFYVTNPFYDTNYFTGTLTPNSSNISVYINYTGIDSNYDPKNIIFGISPKTPTLSGTTQRIDVNVITNFPYSSVLIQAFDNNTLITSTSSTNNPLLNAFLNLTLADFNSRVVTIKTTIITPDQNTTFTKSYFLESIGRGGVMNLVGLAQTLNPTNFLFVFIIPIIIFLGWIGKDSFGNTDNQLFLGGILLAMVVFLVFRAYILYLVGALFVGAMIWAWTRVNR